MTSLEGPRVEVAGAQRTPIVVSIGLSRQAGLADVQIHIREGNTGKKCPQHCKYPSHSTHVCRGEVNVRDRPLSLGVELAQAIQKKLNVDAHVLPTVSTQKVAKSLRG